MEPIELCRRQKAETRTRIIHKRENPSATLFIHEAGVIVTIGCSASAHEARSRKAAPVTCSIGLIHDGRRRPEASMAELIAFALEQAAADNDRFAMSLAVTLLATPDLERAAAQQLIELCYRLQEAAG